MSTFISKSRSSRRVVALRATSRKFVSTPQPHFVSGKCKGAGSQEILHARRSRCPDCDAQRCDCLAGAGGIQVGVETTKFTISISRPTDETEDDEVLARLVCVRALPTLP